MNDDTITALLDNLRAQITDYWEENVRRDDTHYLCTYIDSIPDDLLLGFAEYMGEPDSDGIPHYSPREVAVIARRCEESLRSDRE